MPEIGDKVRTKQHLVRCLEYNQRPIHYVKA
jgi:hypothetical protein